MWQLRKISPFFYKKKLCSTTVDRLCSTSVDMANRWHPFMVQILGGILLPMGARSHRPHGRDSRRARRVLHFRNEGTADYNVSVVKYRLVVDGEELHNIDRGNGVLIIGLRSISCSVT